MVQYGAAQYGALRKIGHHDRNVREDIRALSTQDIRTISKRICLNTNICSPKRALVDSLNLTPFFTDHWREVHMLRMMEYRDKQQRERVRKSQYLVETSLTEKSLSSRLIFTSPLYITPVKIKCSKTIQNKKKRNTCSELVPYIRLRMRIFANWLSQSKPTSLMKVITLYCFCLISWNSEACCPLCSAYTICWIWWLAVNISTAWIIDANIQD